MQLGTKAMQEPIEVFKTQKLIQVNSKILRTVSVCFVGRRQTVHELQWPSGQCRRRSSSKVQALCLKKQQ